MVQATKPRLYAAMLRDHLDSQRQMALVSGPRQVGKTTTCRTFGTRYLNWDSTDDRRLILRGPDAVAAAAGLDQLREHRAVIVFDELHKHAKWKSFLKGFFDVYADRAHVLVTGSSRIDVVRRGSDSLMGRYFRYRMHPWSVAECLSTELPEQPVRPPGNIDDVDWHALRAHGGFPEPFLKRDPRFTRRWQTLRLEQLTRGDLRDLTQLQNLGAMEALTLVLAEQSGQQLVYARLSRELGIAVDTARHWVDLLGRLHYGFLVRPWFANVRKSLRKEPKWFLRDWSAIADPGARAETMVACHLLKAVEGWADLGLGSFELRYLRDKQQREVDFVVIRDRKPWFLVEVKQSDTRLSDSLGYFQREIAAPHAFQAVLELPYVEADCFARTDPAVVPARTLLSQLL
jgi:predicted AAA+ superfamily ATPase